MFPASQVDPQAVELMLRHMYGEALAIPLHLLIPCCTAADRFGLLPLITSLQEQLTSISFTPEAAAALAAEVLACPIPSLQHIILGKAALLLLEDQDSQHHYDNCNRNHQQQEQGRRLLSVSTSHQHQQQQPKQQQWQFSSQSLVQHWSVDDVLAVVHRVLDLAGCEGKEFARAALSCCCQWAVAAAAAAAAADTTVDTAAAGTIAVLAAAAAAAGDVPDHYRCHNQQSQQRQHQQQRQPRHQQQQQPISQQLHAMLQQLLSGNVVLKLAAVMGIEPEGGVGEGMGKQSGLPQWLGLEMKALGYHWGEQGEEEQLKVACAGVLPEP